MGMLWFDKDGQPIPDEQAFALKYGQPPGAVSEYARIGLDVVGDSWVSTIWVGLNHEFRPGRPPLIFETMIFGGEYGDYCDGGGGGRGSCGGGGGVGGGAGPAGLGRFVTRSAVHRCLFPPPLFGMVWVCPGCGRRFWSDRARWWDWPRTGPS